MPAGAKARTTLQQVGLSMLVGSIVGLTILLFVLAIAYIVTRARDGSNKPLWLTIFRVFYVLGGPVAFGLTLSYPLYLKHVYHAAGGDWHSALRLIDLFRDKRRIIVLSPLEMRRRRTLSNGRHRQKAQGAARPGGTSN